MFRVQLIAFPLMAWVTMSNMMLQNIGKTASATLVAMLRQGIAFIPVVLFLPLLTSALGFSGLLGIELAQPIADVISFAVSAPIGKAAINEMRRENEESLRTFL